MEFSELGQPTMKKYIKGWEFSPPPHLWYVAPWPHWGIQAWALCNSSQLYRLEHRESSWRTWGWEVKILPSNHWWGCFYWRSNAFLRKCRKTTNFMHNCPNYLRTSITNSDLLKLFFKQKHPSKGGKIKLSFLYVLLADLVYLLKT